MRTQLLLISVATLALALPTGASASTTASVSGTGVLVTGDAANDQVTYAETIVGTGDAAFYGVRIDNPAGVVPGAGCLPEGSTTAVCRMGSGKLTARLGAGNDSFASDQGYAILDTEAFGEGGNDDIRDALTLDGGDGDDTLRTSGYDAEHLIGGAGTDSATSAYDAYIIIGGAPEDDYGTRVDADVEKVLGSSGDDVFVVGPSAAADTAISGRDGDDTVSFSRLSSGVKASLDGVANDGPSGRLALAGDLENLTGSSGDDELTGNGGPNVLTGLEGRDRLLAQDGDDAVSGGEGDDDLDAGGGRDELFGGLGNDVLRGGDGSDSISYAGAETAVTVSLDGQPNDGPTGTTDNVGADIERVFGGSGDDTLTGSPGDNELSGGEGADKIDGGEGKDKLSGGSGSDRIGGGGGDDELRGGYGDDQIDAGAGEDFVISDEDEVGLRSTGTDTIELRDGQKDAAACPAGIARVLADQHDIVAPSCQLVERFTVGPDGVAQPTGPSPLITVRGQRVRVDRKGVARIEVSCPAASACEGVVRLVAKRGKGKKAKNVVAARHVFAVPAGVKRTLRVRLTKTGRKMLRKRRTLRVELTVAGRAKGAPQTRLLALRLRR